MSTPFFFRLREKSPDAHITVLCRPVHRSIFEHHPQVDEVVELEKGFFLRGTGVLAQKSFDAAYILPTSFSSALLCWAAKIPVRIGHAAEGRSSFLTHPFPLNSRYHYVRRYLSLLSEESIVPGQVRFSFPLTSHGKKEWENLERSLDGQLQDPILVIAPGSRASARRYFPDRFAAVADLFLRSTGGSVVLVGSKDDEVFTEEVCRETRSKSVFNLCGRTTLESLGELLKKSALLLTNESGTMHAAWALGVPSVVLAGASDAKLTAPWGDATVVIQHKELGCVPCVKNQCPRVQEGYKECLKLISVPEVWNAVRKSLKIPAEAGNLTSSAR